MMTTSMFCERMTGELCKLVEKPVSMLCRIWFDIGIPDDQKKARSGVVMVHISNLLEEMISEEKALQSRLIDNIKKFKVDIEKLSSELNIPKFEVRDGATVVQEEKELRIRADELAKMRHERLKKQKKLLDEERQLRASLGLSPRHTSLPTTSAALLNMSQLDELEQDVRQLDSEKKRRLEVFRALRTDVVKLLEDLERVPDTSFSRDVICDDEVEFILSDDNIKQLKQYSLALSKERSDNLSEAATLRDQIQLLWEELNVDELTRRTFISKYFGFRPNTLQALKEEFTRLTKLKEESSSRLLIEAQKSLTTLWERCLTSDKHRQSLRHLLTSTASLADVEKEIDQAHAYYQLNKSVLDKVERHRVLYKEFVDLENQIENRENRPSSHSHKEKSVKKLMKELSAAEQEALSAVEEWELKRKEVVQVGGMRYREYISEQWRHYRADRVLEVKGKQRIESRLILRTKTVKKSGVNSTASSSESSSSSSSVAETPSSDVIKSVPQQKRRFACITPTNIAAKFLKLDEGTRSAPFSRRQTVMTKLMESPGRLKLDSKGFVVPREPVVITRVKALQEIQSTPAKAVTTAAGAIVTAAARPSALTAVGGSAAKPFSGLAVSAAVKSSFPAVSAVVGRAGTASCGPSAAAVDKRSIVNHSSLFQASPLKSWTGYRTPAPTPTKVQPISCSVTPHAIYRATPTVSTAETLNIRPQTGAVLAQPGAGSAAVIDRTTDIEQLSGIAALDTAAGCMDVGSPPPTTSTPTSDIPEIGAYTEFTRGLTQSGKKNFCSSVAVLPRPKPAFF